MTQPLQGPAPIPFVGNQYVPASFHGGGGVIGQNGVAEMQVSVAEWKVRAKVGNQLTLFKVDTGAGLNIISLAHLQMWGFRISDLMPPKVCLRDFHGGGVIPCGVLRTEVQFTGLTLPMDFCVLHNCAEPLLGFRDTVRAGVLRLTD